MILFLLILWVSFVASLLKLSFCWFRFAKIETAIFTQKMIVFQIVSDNHHFKWVTFRTSTHSASGSFSITSIASLSIIIGKSADGAPLVGNIASSLIRGNMWLHFTKNSFLFTLTHAPFRCWKQRSSDHSEDWVLFEIPSILSTIFHILDKDYCKDNRNNLPHI